MPETIKTRYPKPTLTPYLKWGQLSDLDGSLKICANPWFYIFSLPCKNVHFEDFRNALIDEDEEKEEGIPGEEEEQVDTTPWAGIDRDYSYEEVMHRWRVDIEMLCQRVDF